MASKDAWKGFQCHQVQQGSAPRLGQSPESEQTGRWNGRILQRRRWEQLVDKKLTRAIHVHLKPRKPPMSWAASKPEWAAGEGGDFMIP